MNRKANGYDAVELFQIYANEIYEPRFVMSTLKQW